MKNEIDMMLEYLKKLTKEESDFIEHILKWPDNYKHAFLIAKGIFEEKL